MGLKDELIASRSENPWSSIPNPPDPSEESPVPNQTIDLVAGYFTEELANALKDVIKKNEITFDTDKRKLFPKKSNYRFEVKRSYRLEGPDLHSFKKRDAWYWSWSEADFSEWINGPHPGLDVGLFPVGNGYFASSDGFKDGFARIYCRHPKHVEQLLAAVMTRFEKEEISASGTVTRRRMMKSSEEFPEDGYYWQYWANIAVSLPCDKNGAIRT